MEEPLRLDSDLERAKQYTPEMVRDMRRALIEQFVIGSIGEHGMKVDQARIHAEMRLSAWELHQLHLQAEGGSNA